MPFKKRTKKRAAKERTSSSTDADDIVGLASKSARTSLTKSATDKRSNQPQLVYDATARSSSFEPTKAESTMDATMERTLEHVAKRTTVVVEKRERRPADALGAIGPRIPQSNVRFSTEIDHNPEICKDYFETGYCSFGDACQFIHDRQDYKSGYELDREWRQKEKKREEAILRGLDSSHPDHPDYDPAKAAAAEAQTVKFPTECSLCKGDFNQPIVTVCGHYFCEACALKHYRRNPKCAICNKPTRGMFRPARDLKKHLKQLQEAQERELNDGQSTSEQTAHGSSTDEAA
ncbi:MAG: hypothetical protein MHM6MM_000698 [Cercozoa sp. M6MM]